MYKKILTIGLFLLSYLFTYSQQKTDSLKNIHLKEITIIGKSGLDSKNESKPLSPLDDYLEKQENLNLVKRGNYASEPLINNMAAERISVTIDGMKIFCACTDKMDPVTSYLEITNLSKIQINTDLSGNPYATNNIGGSLDMKVFKAGFDKKKLNINGYLGYETNGNYTVGGIGTVYASPVFYSNSSVFFRKTNNYYAGGGNEVNFSQFQKINIMSNAGVHFPGNQILEGSVIYDVATNVGYPALTMDVKSAKGFISSLSYSKEKMSGLFTRWDTKIYFNTIKHVMDDTKRPNVEMHMDMPGESKTFGVYSTLPGIWGKNHILTHADFFYNQSKAEMTMYPKDASRKSMFMYTWPDIRTLNLSAFLEDKYLIGIKNSISVSAKLAFQRDGINSDFGYNTYKIFYPDMNRYTNRLLTSISGKYQYYSDNIVLKAGIGLSSRPPSVTEAYGYYLFNSFDNYDYIGNPFLKQETSWEENVSFSTGNSDLKFTIETSFFYFNNYIIGKPDSTISPMTLNSSGVKVYINLPHASIFNLNLNLTKSFLKYLHWTNKASYAFGKDNISNPLPLIAPISYSSALNFTMRRISAEANLQGACAQSEYSAEYGEDRTPAYLISGVSVGYTLPLKGRLINVKTGIENIFDRKYSTYSDWNNISRKGRNIFINLSFNI